MAGEPPIPPNATSIPQHSRNLHAIYSAILSLCAAVRILSSRQISMAQARIGQDFLSQYCRALKVLRIHTTINHHLAMHYVKFIKLFRPVYGWWLFAFERFNGMLKKLHHNGHDGGRIELTLLRHWVMTHLIYEYLLALPADAHPKEHEYVDQIVHTEAREQWGGMMTELAIYRSEASTDSVSLPRRLGKPINLFQCHPVGTAYSLLLKYCQELWPDLNIVNDTSLGDGVPFYRSEVCRALTYIRKDGIRYGSTSNKKTQADCHAFISKDTEHRVPVEISALLCVKVGDKSPHVCAIVRRMSSDENIPRMPWDL